VLACYLDRCSPLLEVKDQRSKSPETKNVVRAAKPPPQLAYEWYALAASGCCCAAGRRAHFLAPRGDISGGVHRGSLGDSELCMTFAGHSELGAAASTKAEWWDMRLASLLTHLLPPPHTEGYLVYCFFVFFLSFCLSFCLYGYGFLSGGKS